MKKSKNIGVLLLIVFMGISAIPLFSAPAAPNSDDKQPFIVFFENGDDHTNQWLIRTISESEEFNVRSATANNCIELFAGCANYHSCIHKVWFAQTIEQKDIKQPKERIYLSNSCFTI